MSSRPSAFQVLGLLAALTLLFVGLRAVPVAWVEQGPTICLIKISTGYECLGCGMTRAFFYVLHGDFRTAWDLNWRIIIIFPLLGFLVLRGLWRIWGKSPSANSK